MSDSTSADYFCPICRKDFSSGKSPKVNLQNHLSRSAEARHIEYYQAQKAEKARKRQGNVRTHGAERIRRYRQHHANVAKVVAAAENHEVADFRAHDVARISSKKATLKRRFMKQARDLQPPVPPERPRKKLPPILNPYYLLQYGIGIYPYGKPEWKSWKQFYEEQVELIAPGTSVPQVRIV
jgi:hypothetical protein